MLIPLFTAVMVTPLSPVTSTEAVVEVTLMVSSASNETLEPEDLTVTAPVAAAESVVPASRLTSCATAAVKPPTPELMPTEPPVKVVCAASKLIDPLVVILTASCPEMSTLPVRAVMRRPAAVMLMFSAAVRSTPVSPDNDRAPSAPCAAMLTVPFVVVSVRPWAACMRSLSAEVSAISWAASRAMLSVVEVIPTAPSPFIVKAPPELMSTLPAVLSKVTLRSPRTVKSCMASTTNCSNATTSTSVPPLTRTDSAATMLMFPVFAVKSIDSAAARSMLLTTDLNDTPVAPVMFNVPASPLAATTTLPLFATSDAPVAVVMRAAPVVAVTPTSTAALRVTSPVRETTFTPLFPAILTVPVVDSKSKSPAAAKFISPAVLVNDIAACVTKPMSPVALAFSVPPAATFTSPLSACIDTSA